LGQAYAIQPRKLAEPNVAGTTVEPNLQVKFVLVNPYPKTLTGVPPKGLLRLGSTLNAKEGLDRARRRERKGKERKEKKRKEKESINGDALGDSNASGSGDGFNIVVQLVE